MGRGGRWGRGRAVRLRELGAEAGAYGRGVVSGREFPDAPGAVARLVCDGEERFCGRAGRAGGRAAGQAQGLGVVADAQQRRAAGFCDQRHIAAERGHVAAAVVQREEEAAGEGGGHVARAQQAVQLTGPVLDGGAAVGALPVQARERGGDDVADAFVLVGGEETGFTQQIGERCGAGVGQAAQLHVASGGEGEVAVAEAVRGVGEGTGLRRRQESGREPEPGQGAVGGGVQPQCSGAGVPAVPYEGVSGALCMGVRTVPYAGIRTVLYLGALRASYGVPAVPSGVSTVRCAGGTAVPYEGFVPVRGYRGGGRHGGEHTDDGLYGLPPAVRSQPLLCRSMGQLAHRTPATAPREEARWKPGAVPPL